MSPKAFTQGETPQSDQIKPREQWIISKSSAFTLRNHQPHFGISKYDQLIWTTFSTALLLYPKIKSKKKKKMHSINLWHSTYFVWGEATKQVI